MGLLQQVLGGRCEARGSFLPIGMLVARFCAPREAYRRLEGGHFGRLSVPRRA